MLPIPPILQMTDEEEKSKFFEERTAGQIYWDLLSLNDDKQTTIYLMAKHQPKSLIDLIPRLSTACLTTMFTLLSTIGHDKETPKANTPATIMVVQTPYLYVELTKKLEPIATDTQFLELFVTRGNNICILDSVDFAPLVFSVLPDGTRHLFVEHIIPILCRVNIDDVPEDVKICFRHRGKHILSSALLDKKCVLTEEQQKQINNPKSAIGFFVNWDQMTCACRMSGRRTRTYQALEKRYNLSGVEHLLKELIEFAIDLMKDDAVSLQQLCALRKEFENDRIWISELVSRLTSAGIQADKILNFFETHQTGYGANAIHLMARYQPNALIKLITFFGQNSVSADQIYKCLLTPNVYGQTVIHLMARYQPNALIKLLITFFGQNSASADQICRCLSTPNVYGQTAIHLMARYQPATLIIELMPGLIGAGVTGGQILNLLKMQYQDRMDHNKSHTAVSIMVSKMPQFYPALARKLKRVAPEITYTQFLDLFVFDNDKHRRTCIPHYNIPALSLTEGERVLYREHIIPILCRLDINDVPPEVRRDLYSEAGKATLCCVLQDKKCILTEDQQQQINNPKSAIGCFVNRDRWSGEKRMGETRTYEMLDNRYNLSGTLEQKERLVAPGKRGLFGITKYKALEEQKEQDDSALFFFNSF